MSDIPQDFHKQWNDVSRESGQLPPLDEELRIHSEQLQSMIRKEIQQQGGVISFAQFMQMALYEPALGYYTSTQRKLGADGDFVTAPEISPLFGRCLAHFCQQALQGISTGSILEFGAGSGRMAADILLALEERHALPSSYLILELSAELKQRQRQTLEQKAPHLLGRVEWLQSLPEPGFRGIILANELLDAMPVHRFRVESCGFMCLGVAWSDTDQAFVQQTMAASPEMLKALKNIEQTLDEKFPLGYESEVSLAHAPWLKSVSDILDEGLVLLIDYGYGRPEYYLPQRHMGTLMCHYRHRAHDDPFQFVGLQDLTAYVDFTTVAEAGVEQGMHLLGYTTQCGFLLENGLEGMMPDPEKVSQQELLSFAQQVKTLTLPSEMGERFKVMALGKTRMQNFPGFTLQDQRGRL
jgi:SAM-dependent MidA family methyltransferase